MKDAQQYGLPVFQALNASAIRAHYPQDLDPIVAEFVHQCQQQWGDFAPDSLTRALATATEAAASFAATLLFFLEPTDCLIHAEFYFLHPNPWVRWPMTLLLAQYQPDGWFEALCQMLPNGLTQAEMEEGKFSGTFSWWRRECISLLTRFPRHAVIPFIRQALEITIPWSHYDPESIPTTILCDFQYHLVCLLADLPDSTPLQSNTIPVLCGDLWRCTWVAMQLRKQYAENDIIHNHFLKHPEIHAHIRQELQRTFGYSESDQERAIQTYIDYSWYWLIYWK